MLVRRPDSAISGTVFFHIFVIFWDRPGQLICFLHISTRSIDWRNKNWVSCLSRFFIRGYYTCSLSRKWMKFEERILLCHSLDLVEIWRKPIDSHYWSRIFTGNKNDQHFTSQRLFFWDLSCKHTDGNKCLLDLTHHIVLHNRMLSMTRLPSSLDTTLPW